MHLIHTPLSFKIKKMVNPNPPQTSLLGRVPIMSPGRTALHVATQIFLHSVLQHLWS
ncbi:hypothetical protein E2C01_081633 [Portunus trituberculatus]|uniref:Uncharacterized protein n=1 Tax=Portunus trituberculatus TaxID=210409 RepID=A0A5B7IZD3_PORTR|nr:hypothetical protein [Portunus trituberculatus]